MKADLEAANKERDAMRLQCGRADSYQTEITRLKAEVKRLEESNAARQKRWEQLLVERNGALKERDEQAKKFAELEKLYRERELTASETVKKMTDMSAALAAELELVDKAVMGEFSVELVDEPVAGEFSILIR